LFCRSLSHTHTLAYRPTLHTHTTRSAQCDGRCSLDHNCARRNSAMATRRTDFRVFWPTAAARARTAANWCQLMIHVLPRKSLLNMSSPAELWVRFAAGAQIRLHFSFLQELCPVGLFSVCASHSARHNKFHNDGADFCFLHKRLCLEWVRQLTAKSIECSSKAHHWFKNNFSPHFYCVWWSQ